jgi:predicted MPP superfamily phosphohydrolase
MHIKNELPKVEEGGKMKIVALFDTHIPFHIKLGGVFRFIHDFKPDVVVLGGDMHDWTAASHWIANQSLSLDGKTIMKSYDELHKYLLLPLKEAMPKGCKVVFLPGNHEDWLSQTIQLSRNGLGYWELENNIDTKNFNMTILPINTPYRVNENLCYIHGIYTNEFHAKKTVQAYHTSVFYGHTHDVQTHLQISPIDIDRFYKGQSCGCLCSLSPSYLKNKPNKWVNGFHFGYVSGKFFHDVQVIIVNNRFWANNKYYQ